VSALNQHLITTKKQLVYLGFYKFNPTEEELFFECCIKLAVVKKGHFVICDIKAYV
jgi:hypothetical protein